MLDLYLLVPALALAAAAESDYPVPPPQPVKTDIRVGTYIFPGWYRDHDTNDYSYPNHDQDSEWRLIAKFPEPRPLLGFYDDSLPEVNDWHIKWALESGISWFAFDWYWNAGEKRLSRSLEHGFLKARYNEQMDFCIHWCNHGLDWKKPLDFSPEALEAVIDYCAEHYFKRPNYLRIDGRPVFMIWDMQAILEANGGDEAFKTDVLPRLHAVCRKHGVEPFYLIAVHNAPERLAGITSADAATGYSYAWYTPRQPFNPPGIRPYEYMIEALPDYWREIREALSIPFIVSTQSGWDSTPRALGQGNPETLWVLRDNTPELFERSLRDARAFVEPERPYLLIEAWNEWGEGSYIEPSIDDGFGFLEAIRRVFAPEAGPHEWAQPSSERIATYSVLTPEELEEAARAQPPDLKVKP